MIRDNLINEIEIMYICMVWYRTNASVNGRVSQNEIFYVCQRRK